MFVIYLFLWNEFDISHALIGWQPFYSGAPRGPKARASGAPYLRKKGLAMKLILDRPTQRKPKCPSVHTYVWASVYIHGFTRWLTETVFRVAGSFAVKGAIFSFDLFKRKSSKKNDLKSMEKRKNSSLVCWLESLIVEKIKRGERS